MSNATFSTYESFLFTQLLNHTGAMTMLDKQTPTGSYDEVYDLVRVHYTNFLESKWASDFSMGLYEAMTNYIENHIINAVEKEVDLQLRRIFRAIGCDVPENYDDMLHWIVSDVQETADPINWGSGDVSIAFRRWIESKAE